MAGWMDAKLIKIKKYKKKLPRGYPKQYVSVGGGARAKAISDIGKDMRPDNKSLAFDDKMLAFLELHQRFHGVTPARKAVLDQIEKHVRQIEEVSPLLKFFTLVNNSICRADVFYGDDGNHVTRYCMLYRDYRAGVIKTSMNYMFKSSLKHDWENKSIKWKAISPLPNSA